MVFTFWRGDTSACKDVARFDLYPYQITSNQTGSSLYVQRKVVVTLREGLYKWPLHVGTCPDISPQLICSDVQQHEQGHEGGVKREHNYLRCPTNWARSSACRFRNWLCNFRRPWGRSSAGGGHRNLNFNGNNQNEAWNKENYHSSMCVCTIKTYSCNTYIIYSACPSSLLEH